MNSPNFRVIFLLAFLLSVNANAGNEHTFESEYSYANSADLTWKKSDLFKDMLSKGCVYQRQLLECGDLYGRLAAADALVSNGADDAKIIYAELVLYSKQPASPIYSRVIEFIQSSNYSNGDLASIALILSNGHCTDSGVAVYVELLSDDAINLLISNYSQRISSHALGSLIEVCISKGLACKPKAIALSNQFRFIDGDDKVYYFTSQKRNSVVDVSDLISFYRKTTAYNKRVLYYLYKDQLSKEKGAR